MTFPRYMLFPAVGACLLMAAPVQARCGDPIMRTHTAPGLLPGTSLASSFPEKSRTVLAVKVNGVGYPDELTVVQSSGSRDLDKSAAMYIGQYWQWAPGCGKTTQVAVEWNLPVDFNAR